MEFKYSTVLTILFLFLLATPCFSKGGSDVLETTEVYEIDYRGPETHSSIPPPDHSHRKPLPLIHNQSATESPKAKNFRSANMGRKVKKIHG